MKENPAAAEGDTVPPGMVVEDTSRDSAAAANGRGGAYKTNTSAPHTPQGAQEGSVVQDDPHSLAQSSGRLSPPVEPLGLTRRSTDGGLNDTQHEKELQKDSAVAIGATEALPAREGEGGIRIPMNALFILAGLLSVLSAIVSGVFLYNFARDTVNDTVLQGGKNQVEAVAARVVPEVEQMERFIEETEATVLNQVALYGPLKNLSDGYAALNRSMCWNWPARIRLPNDLSGVAVDILFPRTTDVSKINAVVSTSIYYDPLRDGNRSYIYQWLSPSDGVTLRRTPLIYDSAKRFRINQSNVIWEEQADLDYAYRGETELINPVYSQASAWASSIDGTPYWYLQMYQYFRVDGKFFVITAYKYLLRLEQLILDTLGDRRSTNSEIFVFEPHVRAIVGTSYKPESQRQSECYRTFDEFIAERPLGLPCMNRPIENSTFPYLRSLFAACVRPGWDTDDLDLPAEAFLTEINGVNTFVVTRLIVNKGAMRLFLVWTQNADAILDSVRSTVVTVIALCATLIALSALVSVVISVFALLRPMDMLSHDMESLTNFETTNLKSTTGTTSAIREVHQLQHRFAAMASAVHSFSLYVPKDVVKEMLYSGAGAQLGMQHSQLTVMFVDIADFTTLCETLDSDRGALSRLLAAYFRDATRALMRQGATIDKFIGDAIMCFWGAPLAIDEPELRAMSAGLELLRICPAVSRQFAQYNVNLKIRLGANHGPCLCGNIGSEERMNYTALGDTVNTASRMEGLNKEFHSTFMVSSLLLENCSRTPHVVRRHLGAIVVKGKSESIDAFEVFGFSEVPVDEVGDPAEIGHSASSSLSRTGSLFSSGGEQSRKGSPRVNRLNALYQRRAGFLANPQDGFQEALRATPIPVTLISACNKYNLGMRQFLDREYSVALPYFEAVRKQLGQSKACTAYIGFAKDTEKKIEFCVNAIAKGGEVDPTFVATSK